MLLWNIYNWKNQKFDIILLNGWAKVILCSIIIGKGKCDQGWWVGVWWNIFESTYKFKKWYTPDENENQGKKNSG